MGKYSSRDVFDILVGVCCSNCVSEHQDSFSKFSHYHGNIYPLTTCPAEIFLDWLSWDYIQKTKGVK